MSRKTILSISLVLLGVSTGLLLIFAYAMSGGKAAVTFIFLAAAITCILTGSILAFSQLLDRFVNPLMEEIHGDIEDDIRDLKEYRITNTILMTIIIGIALSAFSFFVMRYHKVEAMWGSIPVVLPTFVGMVALAWYIPRTQWYQNRQVYTPMWVFAIPTVGFIFTMAVGLTYTESLSPFDASHRASTEYNTYRSPGFILGESADIGSWGLQLEVPSCSGDECGAELVIGLLILTFILVIGSAFIPHFWLFSGSILLSIMTLIAIHDLRIRRAPAKRRSGESRPRRRKSPSS